MLPKGGQQPRPQRPGNLLVMAVVRLLAWARGLLDAKQRNRTAAGLLMLLAGAVMLAVGTTGAASRLQRSQARPREVAYSDFLSAVQRGSVRSVRLSDASSRVYFDMHPEESARQADDAGAAVPTTSAREGDATSSQRDSSARTRYGYYAARVNDPGLVSMLAKAGVEFAAVQASFSSVLARAFGTMLALWLPLMPLYFIMKRTLGGRVGKRRAKSSGAATGRPITFADVAGVEGAKAELVEVVACLRNSERYAELSARMPSGVLLCGPPGTGKTLLAKAVAGEAGVPFFAASASEFVEMYVGRGAARVRELFREARAAAPCVVFVDELDAVGGRRGSSMNEERDQTLNQLLTELDGFEGRPGVLLLAASNRAESLDPALTRPGRLSRKVVVPLPDERARAAIVALHLASVPMESDEARRDASVRVAAITAGFSGAELANVANEAALLAARTGCSMVTMRELVQGVARTRFGVDGGSAPPPGSLQWRVAEWWTGLTAGRSAQAGAGAAM